MATKNSIFQSISLRFQTDIAPKFRQLFNISIKYPFQGFFIFLTPDHTLPFLQKNYKQYDIFLAHLSKFLKPKDIVIDIGANCGDTLAAMIQFNPEIIFYCIEPDPLFFSYLEKNKAQIEAALKNTSIHLINAFIAKKMQTAILVGKDGTKRAAPISQNTAPTTNKLHETIPFDDLRIKYIPQDQKIRLLKSDVDGFDYDVLNSALNTLKTDQPILFFEADYRSHEEKNQFLNTINTLFEIGYSNFWLFDNFGGFILHTTEISVLNQMIAYLAKQNLENATRTIYYLDILCAFPHDMPLLKKVIKEYNQIPL